MTKFPTTYSDKKGKTDTEWKSCFKEDQNVKNKTNQQIVEKEPPPQNKHKLYIKDGYSYCDPLPYWVSEKEHDKQLI